MKNDTKSFKEKHDNILFYNKSNDYTFNADDVRIEHTEARAMALQNDITEATKQTQIDTVVQNYYLNSLTAFEKIAGIELKGKEAAYISKRYKTHTNEFTPSAKIRMKKTLDVWTYSMDTTTTTAFITLTLSSKWLKNENYEGYVKKFIQTVRYKVGGFNYVWKSELQKNGNIHYHILTDKL